MADDVNLEQLGVTQEEWDSLDPELQQELQAETQAQQQGEVTQETEKPQEETAQAEQATQKVQEWEREKAGLLRDLQERRQRERELKAQLEELNQQQQEAAEKAEEKPDDDVALQADIKVRDAKIKKLEDQLNIVSQEQQGAKQKEISAFLAHSEQEAMEKYSEDKVGKDLCFQNVYDNGFKKMAELNPAYAQVVLMSQHPAEEAYRIGLMHSDFANKQATTAKAQGGAEILDKLRNRPITAGAMASAGGGSSGIDVSTASVDELANLPDDVLNELLKSKG